MPASRRRPGPTHRVEDRPSRARARVTLAVAVPVALLVVIAAAVAGSATAAGPGASPGAGAPTARGGAPATTAGTGAVALGIGAGDGDMVRGRDADAPGGNPNCTLLVPADPTTARGLATPYQLTATRDRAGACHEADADQSAFVQAAILSPDGRLTLYDPLVVDRGTRPITPPAAVRVPAGSTVAVWFGFNGDQLTLAPAPGTRALAAGHCVNGLRRSAFGQFAYCNAPAFFAAAHAAISAGRLRVPAPGTATDGRPCPTVRDFSLVDQDQSDNVTSHYLLGAGGRTGQANAATRQALQRRGISAPVDLANGSDNRLLDQFVAPALGCTAWSLPNQAMDGTASFSLPLNELQASVHQQAPVALVPLNDPMTTVNDTPSVTKTNLYRAGVDQPALGAGDDGSAKSYCANLFDTDAGVRRVFDDRTTLAGARSANSSADSLFTFLAARAESSYESLSCPTLLGRPNPVHLVLTGGVVTDATFGDVAPAAAASSTTAPTGTSPGTASLPAGTTTTGTTSSTGTGPAPAAPAATSPPPPPTSATTTTPGAPATGSSTG